MCRNHAINIVCLLIIELLGGKMSCYIGIEVVLAGENEESVRNATIEELQDYICEFGLEYIEAKPKKSGNVYYTHNYPDGASYYTYEDLITKANKIVDKYGCKIEIITESVDDKCSLHYYYDGEKQYHSWHDHIPYYVNEPENEEFLSTRQFTSDLSPQTAKVFVDNPDLLVKWCGFYHQILCDPRREGYYIGKGYENTERYIDFGDKNDFLSLDNLFLNCKENIDIIKEFDKEGRLLKEHYTEEYYICYKYNSEGQLIEESDSEGRKAIYSYDNNGKLSEKTCFNPKGLIVYLYETDSFNGKYEHWYGYDSNGNEIVSWFLDHTENGYYMKDVNGYDSNGNLVMHYNDITSSFYFYDSNNRLIFRDEDQSEERYIYNDTNRLIYERSEEQENVVTMTGFLKNFVKILPDKKPHAPVYDSDGKLLYSYDEEEKVEKWFYDDRVFVLKNMSEENNSRDLNNKREYELCEYDADNTIVRRIEVKQERDTCCYSEYDGKNNLVHEIVSNKYSNHDEWNEYDENGRLIHTKYTDGREIKYEYDEKGECTELNLNKYGEFTIMDDGFEDDDSEELILDDATDFFL